MYHWTAIYNSNWTSKSYTSVTVVTVTVHEYTWRTIFLSRHSEYKNELRKSTLKTHPESFFLPTSCQQWVPNSKKGNTHWIKTYHSCNVCKEKKKKKKLYYFKWNGSGLLCETRITPIIDLHFATMLSKIPIPTRNSRNFLKWLVCKKVSNKVILIIHG